MLSYLGICHFGQCSLSQRMLRTVTVAHRLWNSASQKAYWVVSETIYPQQVSLKSPQF